MNIQGKTALVTGASRGIGRAMPQGGLPVRARSGTSATRSETPVVAGTGRSAVS